MGLLHRLGLKVEVRETAELAVKGGRLAGPQLLEGADVLGGDGAAAVEVGRADCLELLPASPAGAAAHDEAAAGQDVDGREDFGRQHRRPVRDDHDGREQPQRRGAWRPGRHAPSACSMHLRVARGLSRPELYGYGELAVARHDDVVAHCDDAEPQRPLHACLTSLVEGFGRRLFGPLVGALKPMFKGVLLEGVLACR